MTRRLMTVAPSGDFQTLIAASVAITEAGKDVDLQLAPGLYSHDLLAYRANNVVVSCPGGLAVLDSPQTGAAQTLRNPPAGDNRFNGLGLKGQICFQGYDNDFSGMEIKGAAITNSDGGNAYGICALGGSSFRTSNIEIHHNQGGVMTRGALSDNNPYVFLDVGTKLHDNGNGGLSHNIYINKIVALLMSSAASFDCHVGHDVKSRALITFLINPELGDTDELKASSYNVDCCGILVALGMHERKGLGSSNKGTLIYHQTDRVGDNTGPCELYIQDSLSECVEHNRGSYVRANYVDALGALVPSSGLIDNSDFACKIYLTSTGKNDTLNFNFVSDTNNPLKVPASIIRGAGVRIVSLADLPNLPARPRDARRDQPLTLDSFKALLATFRPTDAPAVPGLDVWPAPVTALPFPVPAPAPAPVPVPSNPDDLQKIADLTAQLTMANATIATDDGTIAHLHDVIAKASGDLAQA